MSSYVPTVAVKLFIDKEKQRVLFAESDKDFVDVLFSFWTLPLGTIVWLLGKQSGVGCLDEVYKSVESLKLEHFQTKACKTMLLEPLSSTATQCGRLKVKIDNTNPRSIYVCRSTTCHERVFSSVHNAICKSCKGLQCMLRELPRNGNAAVGYDADGGFVKSGPTLIITDDLQVAPASTCLVFSLLEKFGLNERADIKEEFLHLDYSKVISLLNRTLISKEPLTGLYFDTVATPDVVPVSLDELPANMFPKEESNDAHKLNVIKIKLIQTADNSAVLYAEVGQDFVDLIFGLLGFPLGSIIKCYGQWPTNGCVDNLYLSVEGSARECIREDCQNLLLSPKLAPFFGCSIKALQVEESNPRSVLLDKCFQCFKAGGDKKCTCSSYIHRCHVFYETNLKSMSGVHDTSRAYIKAGLRNFIVTDDLRILHFSLANTLQSHACMSASNIPKEKLVEKELSLDRNQVLKILRAAIATREALSNVLLPPKMKRLPHQ